MAAKLPGSSARFLFRPFLNSVSKTSNAVRLQMTIRPRQFSTVRPRRALLYVPGSNMKMITKASGLNVDTVVLDLEDAVAFDKKALARGVVVKALQTIDFGKTEVLVRINAAESLIDRDLEAVLGTSKVLPHGIVLPMVEDGSDLEYVRRKITEHAKSEAKSVKIIGIIETALGVTRLSAITSAAPDNLEGLSAGAEDFASDIGVSRLEDNSEVWYLRNSVLIHCKAAGLQALDIVYTKIKDPDSLREESLEGFRMGFNGKAIIHPSHIDVVQQCYSPSKEIIERSQKIMDAYHEHLKLGKGAFTLDGQMIDMPTIKNAESVLESAKLMSDS